MSALQTQTNPDLIHTKVKAFIKSEKTEGTVTDGRYLLITHKHIQSH